MNLLCYRINFYFVVSKVRGVRVSLRTHLLFSSPVQSKAGHLHRDQEIHKIILSCRSGLKRLPSFEFRMSGFTTHWCCHLCYKFFYFVVSTVRDVRASLRTPWLFPFPLRPKAGRPSPQGSGEWNSSLVGLVWRGCQVSNSKCLTVWVYNSSMLPLVLPLGVYGINFTQLVNTISNCFTHRFLGKWESPL